MAIVDNILVKEELNLILLLDNSYSMHYDGRMAQLNNAIPELKDELIKLAEDECVNVKLRVIAFSDEAVWKVGSAVQGEDINDVVWKELEVVGGTSTPKAIYEAAKALKKEYLGSHSLRPVVILVTDGYCNPGEHDEYLKAIDKLKKCLSGSTGKEKVTRMAIGVMDYNKDELIEFASEGIISDVKQPLVFEVAKATDLGKIINWTAVTSLYSSVNGDTNGDDEVVDLGDPDWGDDDDDIN